MAHFNMTNKVASSPQNVDKNSPWAPPGSRKNEPQKQRSAYDDIGNRRSPYDERTTRQSPFDPSSKRSSAATKPGSPTDVIFGKHRKEEDSGDEMIKTMRKGGGGWKPPGTQSRTSPGPNYSRLGIPLLRQRGKK